jgi:hypothetical protein
MIEDPSTPPDDSYRRPVRNSKFLIVIVVATATVVALQYTSRAFFPPEKNSTLWGILVGEVLGGFIFGWLTFRRRTG